MATTSQLILVLVLASIGTAVWAQQCQRTLQIGSGAPKEFSQCMQLRAQGATFAWTLTPENNTLDMAFTGTAPSSSGWVGWGYNPTTDAMIGSTALIAFSNGSGPQLVQYSLTGATKGGAPLTPSSDTSVFRILTSSVSITGTAISFTAQLRLAGNSTTIHHVWNRGPVTNNVPQSHALDPADTQTHATLDALSGVGSSSAIPNLHLRNAHGILNAISWGILLPIGVMAARYLRPFAWADPAWFYIHASCQTLGYTLGVAGWATGLRLGSLSKGIVRDSHRNIGITIFVLATLQVFAMFLRPNKTHKIRPYWNVYHHIVGYVTITLAIVNIFKGFDILQPDRAWKRAYIGIIVALGAIAAVYEVITWIAYFRRRRSDGKPQLQQQQQPQFFTGQSYGQSRV